MKTPHRKIEDRLIETLGIDDWEEAAAEGRALALAELAAGVDMDERYGELRRAEIESRARARHHEDIKAAHAEGLRLIDEWGVHQQAASRLFGDPDDDYVPVENQDEFDLEISLMLSCATRLHALAERYVKPETLAMLDEQVGLEATRDLVNSIAEARRSNKRSETLRKRYIRRVMGEPVEPLPHLCVQCQKKPRHFGDLCKRCADASGQRPAGKV